MIMDDAGRFSEIKARWSHVNQRTFEVLASTAYELGAHKNDVEALWSALKDVTWLLLRFESMSAALQPSRPYCGLKSPLKQGVGQRPLSQISQRMRELSSILDDIEIVEDNFIESIDEELEAFSPDESETVSEANNSGLYAYIRSPSA